MNVTPCSRGQFDADLPEADRLDDRGDTAGEQVRVDQVDQLFFGEPDRPGQQDRHHHRAGVERQHVLKAVDAELGDRQDLVDRVLDRFRSGPLTRGGCCGCHGNPFGPVGACVLMLVGWVDDVRPGADGRKRGVGTCLNTVPRSDSRLGNEADPHGNKPEPVVRQLVSCTGTFSNVAECWTVGSWARGQAGQITRPGPEQPVPGDRQAANPAPTAPRTTSDEWDARRAAWPPAYRTCSPLSVGGGAKRSPDHLRKPSFRHRNLSGDYAHVYSLLSDLSDFIPIRGISRGPGSGSCRS